MPTGIQVFASIRNPDAPSQPAARPRTAIRLLFGEAYHWSKNNSNTFTLKPIFEFLLQASLGFLSGPSSSRDKWHAFHTHSTRKKFSALILFNNSVDSISWCRHMIISFPHYNIKRLSTW